MSPRARWRGFMTGVRVERLDHLGIVAGICREIGLAEYLDALAGPSQQQVSVGTATVAMILNGLGFSNRRLYLVSQFLGKWIPGWEVVMWGDVLVTSLGRMQGHHLPH